VSVTIDTDPVGLCGPVWSVNGVSPAALAVIIRSLYRAMCNLFAAI
jgi:hypothetical protein